MHPPTVRARFEVAERLHGPHRLRGFRNLLLASFLVIACAGEALATDPVQIVRVEEDWVVEIGEPDPASDTPQIITVMAPWNSTSHVHAVFELNHLTLPDYLHGGMQLQVWYGDYNASYNNFPTTNKLNTPGEVITYTVAQSVSGGQIKFEVLNGQSSTWGAFGGQGYLKSTAYTLLSDLNTYNLNTSLQNSRVGYASHRVRKFARKEVRFYSAQGLVGTNSTEQVVHAYNPQES